MLKQCVVLCFVASLLEAGINSIQNREYKERLKLLLETLSRCLTTKSMSIIKLVDN